MLKVRMLEEIIYLIQINQHKPDDAIKERLEKLKQVFRQTQGDLFDMNESRAVHSLTNVDIKFMKQPISNPVNSVSEIKL
jgi:hypothetical protein